MRVLNERIKNFLRASSPNRDFIVDYVKDSMDGEKNRDLSRSVALCFRGNKATLYYRCHQLLRMGTSRDKIIGEFDFRHSRFTPDYRAVKNELKGYGVYVDGFDENNRNARLIKLNLDGENAVTPENLGKILFVYRRLIDDFLNVEKNSYQYDIPSSSTDGKVIRAKSPNTEKDRQQRIYAEHFYNADETFYDLEYAEHDGGQIGAKGRFDLLGIKRAGARYVLEFTELKSTAGACSGSAGIIKHQEDYLGYCRNPDLVRARKEEACAAMDLLCEILGKPYFENLSPDNMDAAVKFIFTDQAVEHGRRYNPPEEIEKLIIE